MQSIIRDISIFHGLSEKSLDFIVGIGRERTVPKGEWVFKEGDHENVLYVIEEGEVDVLKLSGDKQILICTMGPGNCFGELELIDLEPRTASILATTDLRLLCIDNSILIELYKKHAEDFASMMLSIAREISRRLRATDQIIIKYENAIDAAGFYIQRDARTDEFFLEKLNPEP